MNFMKLFEQAVEIETESVHCLQITVFGRQTLYARVAVKDLDDDGDLDVHAQVSMGGRSVLDRKVDLGDIDYADSAQILDALVEYIENTTGIDIPGLGK